LFDNRFLEKFSRIHFTVPLFVFIPAILYCFYRLIFIGRVDPFTLFAGVLSGLVFWTFFEYILHRFIFHYTPTSKLGKSIHFLTHGIHHDYPNDSKRLVIPLTISIPVSAFFYLLFQFIFNAHFAVALFAGFLTGYLWYDMMHYLIHHSRFKNRFIKKLQKHHMSHHYRDDDLKFGVTTNFWDKVFNTEIKKTGHDNPVQENGRINEEQQKVNPV